MVVVSGTWMKNVAPYLPQINNEIEVEDNVTMAAKAILICRPNSHPFQERTLILDQPIKVGRSVARAKPTPTNAIFDCKVLSRHHALLSYEDGKFYLQDTKSSNGTFVNNNRLSTENYEVNSGDIVQFGVDVVENNRKVTHGCIIATLRLFLADGKEAKASPSITEGETHGVVPLDDLYKLNQILQEANQREQCLESKLSALQNVVEETKRSADESWQAYVGEERLLSRLSALETQLQQARSNWSDDKLKEEIAKLRENNEKYQEAAKEALEKVHSEKQEAIVLAMEQERAKISAEQDALLAREQLEQAQLEIQEIAQKLTETQTKANEEKHQHEKQVRELEQHMEEEEAKIIELEAKIYELTLEISKKQNFGVHIERPDLICENDFKLKAEILAENEILSESIRNRSNSNGFEQNHISLTVAPVEEECEKEKTEDLESESLAKDDIEGSEIKNKEGKRVSFNVPEDETKYEESENRPSSPTLTITNLADESSDFDSDRVDSKTLKYQYQSAQREQIELRRKIEILEKNSETNQATVLKLNNALSEEREISSLRLLECMNLEEKLAALDQKWKHCLTENQDLQETMTKLKSDIELLKNTIEKEQEKNRQLVENLGSSSLPREEENEKENDDTTNGKMEILAAENKEKDECKKDLSESEKLDTSTLSNISIVSSEQLMHVEEELVLLKERYAQNCEEKVKLQRDLLKMKVQYDMVRDNMYNKYFWYVGPLVIIVIYLLIREWVS